MKTLIETIDSTLSWGELPQTAAWVIEQGIAIQQIPAPTFAEHHRAEFVASMMRALGLRDVMIDALANVYGCLPGAASDHAAVMLAAHTDTIFSSDTDLTLRRDGNLIYAPGLGDNSIGVSGMLGLVWALTQAKITPARDLWFVATTREEGLGDLGGMRAAFEQLKSQIDTVINLEGLAYGHVYHAGIAVRRLNITIATEGGHSWLHFGKPSAAHKLVELGARIASIHLPQQPRTTYNIGMIRGGDAINAIASRAELWLDMRSEDKDALAKLERQVHAHIDAVKSSDVRITTELVGDRPPGFIDPSHPLVQGAVAALKCQGVRASLETGSTDGNVPLSFGVPTVTIGITRGGNAHRLDEYIDTEPVAAGMRQLIVLALAAAENGAARTK